MREKGIPAGTPTLHTNIDTIRYEGSFCGKNTVNKAYFQTHYVVSIPSMRLPSEAFRIFSVLIVYFVLS
jgi:hypothetical protein